MEHTGAGGNDHTVTDRDSRRNEYIGGDPDPFAEGDRRRGQRHGRVRVIMAGGAEKAVLADRAVRAERDPIHAVAVHMVAQATVIAHGEVPRRPDFR